MATTIYALASIHVNKHPYPVMVPPHAQPIPREVEQGIFFAPVFEPFDLVSKQKSVLTINDMVTMVTSKTSFDIISDQDVLEILHQIDAYVEEVYPIKDQQAVKLYLPNMLKLRELIYRVFWKVLNRHPEWKEAYEDQGSVLNLMTQLYRQIGVNLGRPATLLEELAICPTIRRHERVEKDNKPAEDPRSARSGLFDLQR